MDDLNGNAANRKDRLTALLRICGQKIWHATPDGCAQTDVLLLLAHGLAEQKEIQERLRIQSGSISELTGKLERKGLILRMRGSEDKRRVVLALTRDGQEAVRNMKRYGGTPVSYDMLTEEEIAELIRLLEKLTDGWGEEGPRVRRIGVAP